ANSFAIRPSCPQANSRATPLPACGPDETASCAAMMGRRPMPYVQRNSKLEIIGLYANPQPGIAEEFVVEEHPEVQALRDEMGATEWPSQMPSSTEMRRAEREQQALLAEGAAMDAAIVHFLKAWSNLETSLSTLLYEGLDIRPRT